MPNTAHRTAAAILGVCLLQLAGCGNDTGSNDSPIYAGAGAVGGMGLGGNLGNPEMNMGVTGGAGGMMAAAGSGGSTGGTGGLAGMMAMTGGMGAAGTMSVPTGGMGGGMVETGGMGGGMMETGGSGGATATGGSSGGNPDDMLNEVRQVCVDTINMYRATLDLPPLGRATPEQEMCSDNGAKMDADSGQAHGSAGMCDLGSQNTCPGYRLGFGGPTLADTLKRCLQQMWDEGEPPVSRSECEQDYRGCFLMHGHYLNMSDPRATVVGCGFYDMGDDTWWMNQNFALDWRR